MEAILLEILDLLQVNEGLSEQVLEKVIHRHNQGRANPEQFAKKQLLPFYLRIKQFEPKHWATWQVNTQLEARLMQTLRIKPRRTASGVATITVITKPWICSNDCLFCPNDIRMPKSYLSAEPACQRAERNSFDPYLQVISRLQTLIDMGHATDKIELIVLGGTWSDYPLGYQVWFVKELFRALNESGEQSLAGESPSNLSQYQQDESLAAELQQQVNQGLLSYNQAVELLYMQNPVYQSVASSQTASFFELIEQQQTNETALHRVVGLTIETRPDNIDPEQLYLLRRLGCTKIQIGIQSLDQAILNLNQRSITVQKINDAFCYLRLFGFKIHAHFMLNLLGSTPESDKQDYLGLVSDPAYLPDEVKLYPCALVQSSRLVKHYQDGSWQPYSESELIDVLTTDVMNTPDYTRISRMVRDIAAPDIVAGNKKTNLRQMVENDLVQSTEQPQEIRYREINRDQTEIESLALDCIEYSTTATQEHFLQWVTSEKRIVGFLRLSLPKPEYLSEHQAELPIQANEAMIREVHIYGVVARLNTSGEGAQHYGLGRRLIDIACDIAKASGYQRINVISSVGTREYYRNLGFYDKGLYQQREL